MSATSAQQRSRAHHVKICRVQRRREHANHDLRVLDLRQGFIMQPVEQALIRANHATTTHLTTWSTMPCFSYLATLATRGGAAAGCVNRRRRAESSAARCCSGRCFTTAAATDLAADADRRSIVEAGGRQERLRTYISALRPAARTQNINREHAYNE